MPLKVEPATIETAARLMSEGYNSATTQRHFDNEMRFSFYNHAPLIKAFETGQAKDLAEIGKVGENKPILILASGPSLDEALPLLKDWPHPVMVSTSHATTCIHHGREPEYIVALDPDSYPDELAADTWEGRKSTLIFHPGINPDLLAFWKGPMLLFRKFQPQTPFYSGPQKVGYTALGEKVGNRYDQRNLKLLIPSQLPMLGCVLSAQICIAKQFGFRRIYLAGADFELRRFTRWRFLEGTWKEEPDDSKEEYVRRFEDIELDPQTAVKIIELPNGMLTTPINIFYMHQVVIAWRITECDVVNCSPRSNLTIMPTVDIKEVVRKKGEDIKGFSEPEIVEAAENYLALQNVYFFNIGKGIMPREFKDPLTDIPRALRELKVMLEQQNKGSELDVDANMNRIKKLWERVMAKNAP